VETELSAAEIAANVILAYRTHFQEVGILTEEESGHWIRVEESKPEEMTTVLVCLQGDFVTIGFRYDGGWDVDLERIWLPLDEDVQVTHWMWLPALPEIG